MWIENVKNSVLIEELQDLCILLWCKKSTRNWSHIRICCRGVTIVGHIGILVLITVFLKLLIQAFYHELCVDDDQLDSQLAYDNSPLSDQSSDNTRM